MWLATKVDFFRCNYMFGLHKSYLIAIITDVSQNHNWIRYSFCYITASWNSMNGFLCKHSQFKTKSLEVFFASSLSKFHEQVFSQTIRIIFFLHICKWDMQFKSAFISVFLLMILFIWNYIRTCMKLKLHKYNWRPFLKLVMHFYVCMFCLSCAWSLNIIISSSNVVIIWPHC